MNTNYCETLEASVAFDQINVTELVAFEGPPRRLQLWGSTAGRHVSQDARPWSDARGAARSEISSSSRNVGRRVKNSFSPPMILLTVLVLTKATTGGGRHRGRGN